jgi:ribosome maturation factor RimP
MSACASADVGGEARRSGVSDLEERIWALVEPYLAVERVELDDVEIRGGRLLRVVVDADRPLELDHIAALSRGIGRLIDEEDPFPGSYTLEVTSPGLERNLRRPSQFAKSVGRQVVVKTDASIEDARQHKGALTDANGDGIVVEVDGRPRSIAYGDIASARTVFVWEKGEKPGKAAVSRS